jgi:hypothetical protein
MSDKFTPNMMPNMMSNMMFTNHIMTKFNGQNSHSGMNNTTTIFSDSFVSETLSMFMQIFAVSFFAAFSAYCSTSMEYIKNIFTRLIKRFIHLLFSPFINFYYYILKKIYGDQAKYKIVRTCSQFTTELIRNSDLFEIIQWYINSDICVKIKKNTIIEKSKEIYYQNPYNYINDFNDQNIANIRFNVGTTYGEDIVIKFNSHEIVCSKEKQDIEIKGELQTEKRDNICYYFETYDLNPESDIIERFFQKAIIEYNKSKKEWKQKIFHNDGDIWEDGQDISAPSSLKTVVMRNEMKETLENSVDFFLTNSEFYAENGLRRKLVIANMGPPGTGKTTTAIAMAKQHKMHIYSLNLENSTKGELKYLIDKMDTKHGILLIDDFDHYYSKLGEQPIVEDKEDSESEGSPEFKKRTKRYNKTSKKEQISYHELLTVFDGTGSKDGLIIFLNLNDPSKIFKSTNIEDLALFRDRRVNLLLTFEYCNHKMIEELYFNIFKMNPDMNLIKNIPEDFYAPCVIAQQFIELYERYSKIIQQKQKEIDQILIDLANQKIKTSQDKIKDYLKKLEFYNKEKIQ